MDVYNIASEHNAYLHEAILTIIFNSNRAREDSESLLESIVPGKCDVLEKIVCEMEDTCCAMDKEVTKCIDMYNAGQCNTNPIGMKVPRPVYKPDADVKAEYDKLRTVLHDEYDKCVQEGGTGRIKFVDTLASHDTNGDLKYSAERSNTLTSSFVDKDVEKISRDDLIEAVETLKGFDSKIKELIQEAEGYVEDYNKRRCLLQNKPPVYNFSKSVKNIAESVLLCEDNFINMVSIEARKHMLVEQAKSACKLLYGITTHNPRNIKESAINVDLMVQNVGDHIDDAIYEACRERESVTSKYNIEYE